MSNFDSNQFVTDLQIIQDQQTVKSFNNSPSEPFPQVGSVVLRLVGFGVFTVVGLNPTQTRVGNQCHQSHTQWMCVQGEGVGKVTRWNKRLVQKCKVAVAVPLHLVSCINPPTLCQMEPRKLLGLETLGYLILQDLLIISPDFSFSKSKSCSNQVTRFSKLKHLVYRHDWCAGNFGRTLSFSKHGNQIAQMSKPSHLCQLFFKILFQ